MATSSADTPRPLGDVATGHPGPPPGSAQRAPLGPTLALTATLAFACFAVVMSLVLLVIHPDPKLFVTYIGIQQNQHAKTFLYVVAFALILPLALIAVPRVADAIAAGPNGPALGMLSGLLAATLGAAVVFARVSAHLPWGDGLKVVLGAVGIWAIAAGAALHRASRPRPWQPLLRAAGLGSRAALLAGLLLFGAVLCVTSVTSLSLPVVVLGAVAVAAVLFLYERRRLPGLRGRSGAGVDVVIVGLLLLAIPDVVVFSTSSAPLNLFFPPGIIQFHHDFLLGPANQLLAGGALMVNAPVSQYGVGSIYFLAAWFHLVPIGYGTYGFLDGILTALFYAAGYCVLRISGVSRLLAASALAVGVVALIYSLVYPIGSLPQQGPLRFGLPMAAILPTVAALRWPRFERLGRAAALAVLGVSSIWALEGFAYTLFTVAAMVALQAWLLPPAGRWRWLGGQAALAVGACVCAHLILAGATLAGSGQLPDWGEYLSYLNAFLLGGKVGDLTYGFAPWSPALAIGAVYLASAIGIVLIVGRRSKLIAGEQTVLVALAGMTAFGVALLSYSDNRSSTYLLPYVALPALLVAALWLGMLLRSPRVVPVSMRRASLAFTLSVAVILVAASWPVGGNFSRSALAHAYPGGGLGAALHRLWHPPPIDLRAPAGQRLLERYMPGQRRVLIVIPSAPELATEILMRSGRANLLPIGDPTEMSFLPSLWVPKLRQAIAELEPGTRLLIDQKGLDLLAMLRADPSIDPLVNPAVGSDPLDEWILQRIDRMFLLRPIRKDGSGYVIAELAARR